MAWSTAFIQQVFGLLASHKVSLHTGDPGITGANELGTYGSSARQNAPFAAPAGTTDASSSEISFSNNWDGGNAALTYVGLFSAAGVFKMGGPLNAVKNIQNGDVVKIPLAALIMAIANS